MGTDEIGEEEERLAKTGDLARRVGWGGGSRGGAHLGEGTCSSDPGGKGFITAIPRLRFSQQPLRNPGKGEGQTGGRGAQAVSNRN